MGTRWLNTDHDPLLVIEFPARYSYEELDEEVTALVAWFRERAASPEKPPVVVVVDLSLVETSTAKNRRRIAEGIGQVAEFMSPKGQAYVVQKPVVRGALTALTWLKTAPWPVRVFRTREQALGWGLAMLEREDASSF